MDAPDYELPASSIAQTPAEPRDSARLLDATAGTGALVDRSVRELPDLIGPGDVVVVNDSRVIPARLPLEKATGGQAEVLLLEPVPDRPDAWTALVRPGRRLPPGTLLGPPGFSSEHQPALIEVGPRLPDEVREVVFLADPQSVIDECGQIALPPYIHETLVDQERYQTVYANRPGSVAAPTAGLHLTAELLARVVAAGAEVHAVDLAVGLATFRPLPDGPLDGHRMHTERYRIPRETWDACRRADRVIAVGTTTVRALESAGVTSRLEGDSDLFIRPGFCFSVVDVLMTNFHMPRSTLLLLLEAFMGTGWRDAYVHALQGGYRFLSFGDAMIAARA